jgi:hypothetical protein
MESVSTRFHTSITERGDFRTCRRRWHYSVVEHLQHQHQVPWALYFGECIHKGLEGYYTENIRDPVVAKGWFLAKWEEFNSELLDLFGGLYDSGIGEEWRDWQEKGFLMLEYYDIYDRQFPFWDDVIEVNIEERGFTTIRDHKGNIVDGSPLLSGRIDLVVRRPDGIWIVDHKTAASAYDARALDVDDQLTGYAYIYYRLTGDVPRGVIYNALIKDPPKPPRILKDGSLSKDKSQRTTYDLYLQAIEENDLDASDYEDFLALLKEKHWHQFFLRDTLEKNLHEIQQFEKRLYAEYLDMQQTLSKPDFWAYPNPSQWNCGSCSYVALCQATEEGTDDTYLRENMYEVIEPRVMIPKGV